MSEMTERGEALDLSSHRLPPISVAYFHASYRRVEITPCGLAHGECGSRHVASRYMVGR